MSPADAITTSVTNRDGVAVVTVSGEIDLKTAPTFESAITTALEEAPTVLVVELSAVDFMASVGLRILAAARERLDEAVRVVIVANNPATRRPIQLTGLDQMFSLYRTLGDALTAVGSTAD
ncbi:MAG: STAS domain-containing protein [Mycobacterium sp.]|uniref:STAS domain-containing protein n=1 Tax=Mycobacterium sp. TaxID=1785 RepID=UPI003CC5A73C